MPELATSVRPRARTAQEYEARQAARRRAGALDGLARALEEVVEAPPPVTSIPPRKHGLPPKLPAAAFELARRVYFLEQGSLRDAARAVIAEGLSETTDVTVVFERLQTWWAREGWPKRPTLASFAIRDAIFDGGLFRSDRVCAGVATGSGPAPKGKKCSHSALPDSEFCFHHDARPQYEEARRRQAERLADGRRVGMVPLAPFQRWCDARRRQMLIDARASGRPLHPNNTGWSLLADAFGVAVTVLSRWMLGKHSDPTRPPVTRIRATTVQRYVARLGATFEDVYGHPPPSPGGRAGRECPSCGGAKNHESKTCRRCYEATVGDPCTYVTRAGRRCHVTTAHASGVCATHRKTTERVPKPRHGRVTSFTTPMLMFALDEYRDVPVLAWVARRMWETDAGGVRGAFKSQGTVASGLVKQFRKRGWREVETAQRALAELEAEHGPVAWPERGAA